MDDSPDNQADNQAGNQADNPSSDSESPQVSSGKPKDIPADIKKQKKTALRMFRQAAVSPSLRWEFCATWRDVVAKARRIRTSGGVRITASPGNIAIAPVRGTHDVYHPGFHP